MLYLVSLICRETQKSSTGQVVVLHKNVRKNKTIKWLNDIYNPDYRSSLCTHFRKGCAKAIILEAAPKISALKRV